KIKIEPGSFYEETGISIERASLYDSFLGSAMTRATHSYNIKVRNLLNSVNLKKPITIEFEYYGPKEGGIYEFKNGRWTYLYSQFEGDKIYADIHTNRYLGGTYAVFIDETYKTMDDIGGHWAARSIETFLRRNHISGYPDRTFRPDQSITRAEFVKILDNVYGWSMYSPYTHTSINFADSSVFGVFADSISKAVSLGYVKGYTDNTFRPHIPITYQEVEWLMQRITGRQDFKWYTVAEKIFNDYYVRSKSYNSKENYITRAEVVYLLHSLEEGLL
ncbi:MAG: S-layer homology domain-containing protein, partial [Alkaliphilus sp.]|nr:S-layer homology domain-containing protein [Alkaliphilus sp.]